jgi:hypothetical protein
MTRYGFWTLRNQVYLGDEAFVKKLHRRLGVDEHLTEVPRATVHPGKAD